MRTDHLAFALEIQSGEVAPQDEQKNEGQQEDDELERLEEQAGDLGGAEFPGSPDEVVDDEEQDDQDGDDDQDRSSHGQIMARAMLGAVPGKHDWQGALR